MQDEYDRIYGNDPLGFLFKVKPRHIGKPIPLTAKELGEHPAIAINEDQIVLYCETCDVHMFYKEGNGRPLNGKWVCEECFRTVRENTVYKLLDTENSEYLDDLKDEYDDIY